MRDIKVTISGDRAEGKTTIGFLFAAWLMERGAAVVMDPTMERHFREANLNDLEDKTNWEDFTVYIVEQDKV